MRILVCGGRDYGNIKKYRGYPGMEEQTAKAIAEYKYVHKVLNDLCIKYSKEYNPDDNWLPTDITIIEGGAKGADEAASDFAIVHYTQSETFYAKWNQLGNMAGYVRNKQMLTEGKPDLVVAFPGGKGTAMMVKLAREAGVEVIEYNNTQSD